MCQFVFYFAVRKEENGFAWAQALRYHFSLLVSSGLLSLHWSQAGNIKTHKQMAWSQNKVDPVVK